MSCPWRELAAGAHTSALSNLSSLPPSQPELQVCRAQWPAEGLGTRCSMTSFGGFGTLGSSTAASPGAVNPNKDVEVSSPPADSVSSLHFSPVANHLLATSWDGQVRCVPFIRPGQHQEQQQQPREVTL